MRYKLGKLPLHARMNELGQNQGQKILYLRHTLATLMDENSFALFDALAQGYNIYFMLLNQAFDLIRLNYQDYLIIAQQTEYQYIIEIRKKGALPFSVRQ